MGKVFCRAAAVLILGLGLQFSVQAQERDGRRLFQDFGCSYCHGITGYRGGIGGQPLAPGRHSFDSFRQLVRFPADNMPPYPPEALDDDQLRRIYEYLESVEESPDREELSILP